MCRGRLYQVSVCSQLGESGRCIDRAANLDSTNDRACDSALAVMVTAVAIVAWAAGLIGGVLAGYPGTYSVSNVSVVFSDIARCRTWPQCTQALEYRIKFGRQVAVNVYLPVAKPTPSPLIVFAYESPDTVALLATMVASSGVVVAAFPVYDLNHPWDFAKDLLFVTGEMQAENVAPSSPFYNSMVPSVSALMGQGSAASAPILTSLTQLTAYRSKVHVSGIIALFPQMSTRLGLLAAAAASTPPALVFGAQNDCVYPTQGNALPVYNALQRSPAACKTYVEIIGASSCNVTDALVSDCHANEIQCGAAGSMPGSLLRPLVGGLITSWVAGILQNNATEWSRFNSVLRAQTGTRLGYVQSCEPLGASQAVPLSVALHE